MFRKALSIPRNRYRNPVVNIKYTVALQTLSLAPATATEFPYGLYFTLAQCNKVADMTNMYDRYRIRGVKVKAIPHYNESQVFYVAGGPNMLIDPPYAVSAIDYDDATVGSTTQQSLLLFENAKTHSILKGWSRFVRPRLAVGAYSGAFTSYANTGNKQWIDAASNSVQYYGLKVVMPPTSLVALESAHIWDLLVTYYVQFKDPRLM